VNQAGNHTGPECFFGDQSPQGHKQGTKAIQASPDSPTLGNAAVINRPLIMAGSHFDLAQSRHVTYCFNRVQVFPDGIDGVGKHLCAGQHGTGVVLIAAVFRKCRADGHGRFRDLPGGIQRPT
jgi:hypothetical protein